VFVQRVKHK